MNKIQTLLVSLLTLITLSLALPLRAEMAVEVDAKATEALEELYTQSSAAKELGSQSKGMLIFPSVKKAGLIVGAETGTGVLRVNGETVDYYNTTAASVGLQAGIAKSSRVIMFLEQEALEKFRESKGWEAGVDASIALLELGTTLEGNTTNIKEPVVGFVFGEKGLMAGISLEGSKYTKIDKK